MCSSHLRAASLWSAGMLSLALAAIGAANAQQFQSQPSQSLQRPVYSQPPTQRISPSSPSAPGQDTTPGMTKSSPPVPIQRATQPSVSAPPTQPSVSSQPSPPPQAVPAQMAAQPAPSEPPRRPQPLASGTASAQAATACMNAEKSASVDTVIKGCDAVISQTLKNLANAYYFRGSAKFGKSDFDGAIGDYGQALRIDPADPTISTAAPPPTKPRRTSTARSPTTTKPSRPVPTRSMPTTIAVQSFSARATSPALPPTTVR